MLLVTGWSHAQTSDFGDHSLFVGASSTANGTLKIGAAVDAEAAATTNVTATGDDTTGTDDEDGVTLPASIGQGAAGSLSVTLTNTRGSSAYLNVWIDWNNNGVLTDSGEQVATNTAIGNGTTNSPRTISFTAPVGAIVGAVGVRVRLTSNASPGPDGADGVGEVEDHLLNVAAGFALIVVNYNNNTISRFNGADGALLTTWAPTGLSAPNYGYRLSDNTLLVANGSANTITKYNPFTGAFISTLVASGSGLNFPYQMAVGQDGSIYIANQNAGNVLRFNQTTGAVLGTVLTTTNPAGFVFDEAGQMYVTQNTPGGTMRLYNSAAVFQSTVSTWPAGESPRGLAWGPDGRLYVNVSYSGGGRVDAITFPARTRSTFVTLDSGSNPYTGIKWGPDGNLYVVDYGENEMHVYTAAGALVRTITSTLSGPHAVAFTDLSANTQDYGDYSSFASASSTANATLRLGNESDTEATSRSTATANGDDIDDIDDEDGVTLPDNLVAGSTGSITIKRLNTSGAVGYLSGWIDFNNNGVLTDSGEQVIVNQTVATGTNGTSLAYTFSVPPGATVGRVGARFRLCSTSGVGPTGSVGNGEVEDYLVNISAATTDFGDFSTFASASSTTNSTLRIGATVDAEAVATTNVTATGDDTTGSDDEDGVTLPTSWMQGAASSLSVNLTNTTGATAYLNVWIDFNLNGVLTDSGEQVAVNTVIATGTAAASRTVSFTVPSGATLGTAGVRVRLTSTTSPGPTGASGNGEVEDYVVTLAPSLGIGNLVWNDANENGLFDPEESGINNVLVELWTPGADNAIGGTGGNADTRVTSMNTAGGGLYNFSGLSAGYYFVKVPTPPLSRTSLVSDPTDNGQDGDNNASQPGGSATAAFSPVIQLAAGTEPGSTGTGNIDNTIDFGFASNIGSPFVCDNRFYIMQNAETTPGSGVWDTTLYHIGPGQTLVPIFIFTGYKLNGLAAYGGYLYCVDQNGNNLYRINSQGVLVDMGIIAGLPDPGTSAQWSGATALTNGRMILNLWNFNQATTTLYTIDLASATLIGSGVSCTYSTGGNMSGNMGDIVWDPLTNRVYGYNTIDTSNLGLFEINLTTGVCTRVAAAVPGAWGSIVIDANGLAYGYGSAGASGSQDTLYVFNRTNGVLNGSITAVGTGPAVSNSDGAACPGAPPSMKIGNLVWNDLNNNGVKDTSEAGIDGVSVQLFLGGQNPLTATPTATVSTAGGGLYAFNNLSPGQYFLYIPTPPSSFPLSSTVTDTADNAQDNDDNGIQTAQGQPVRSPMIALTAGAESATDGDTDLNSDLSIDFGFLACAGITISPASATAATVGSAYSQTTTASGGTAPYSWAVSAGALPAGLSLNTSTGAISGTPTSGAAASYTLRATDANGCTGTRAYTLTPACLPITITPSSLSSGLVNTAYSQTMTASGGLAPYSSWTLASGTLPNGLTLNLNSGVISGTPTASNGAGASVTLRVTDSAGCQGTLAVMLKICPAITISPTTLANGTVGSIYSQTLTATGGASPYSYTVSSGTLPTGLSLDPSSGILSGTPTSTAAATFIITATDANGCAGTRSFSVTPAPNTDFGDFSTFASASNTNNGSLRMGSSVDYETAQTANATATGDDTTGADDEDGATIPASITAGASVTLPVVVTNASGAAASLNAWIDFNNNGSLADAGEQIATNVSIANGASSATQNVTFTVPVGASVGTGRGLRFRLTSATSPGPSGVGGMGEVEDYVVTIAAPTEDFGDFSLFPTASSVGASTLRLGAGMDVEGAPTLNAAATGDDTTGTDDEDGVTVPAMITQGIAGSITANVTNTLGVTAYLNAWIDFNGNGVLTDAGEQIAVNTTVTNATSNSNRVISFTTPDLVKVGTVGVRVRITSILSPGPDGSDGTGEVEDYTTSIVANTDFGDNSSLPSASSRANSTLRLGVAVDSEGSPATNATATGDDLDGSDDEDGVTVPSTIAQGAAGSITVNVTNTSGAAAFLNAWIDFNRNGILTDAGEQVAVNTSIATGTSNISSTINFTAPVAASLGTAAVRVRLTSVTAPGADGLDGNGEVEDYLTEIVVPTTDFGDELDFADASSTANNALKLGALVDVEGSSTRNAAASGDDTTGSDDEDALTFPSVTAGQPVTLPVTLTNTTGTAAFLNAWIDYNNNGVLTDAGEQIATNVSVPTGTANGTINLDFTIPTNAVTAAASLGTRFRLTSTASPGPTGNFGTGEVEDHPVVILAPLTDFGDHSGYADVSNTASSNLRLGLLVDTEYASTRNSTATGDDVTGNDDEDGVTLPALTAGAPATIPVTVTNTTGAIGFLNAWIDYNNNGVFTDSGEQIATNTSINTGSSNLAVNISVNVPATAVTATNVGVRVRITSLTSPGASGAGGVGEVEDYVVNIAAPTTDFGDFATFGSASSTRNSNLKLGALTDTEFVATTNTAATGDDTTGSDDEDAIVFPSMTAGAPATIPVLVTNTSGAAANLNLWLDYNGNGVLTDAGEQIATNVSIPTGSNNITQNISITIPTTALTGVNLGARVRLTSTASPGATGASGNGEVEDYVVIIAAPTTDFGDFSGFADASQGANPALRLGANLDTEFVSTRNATATGDDTTGTDDEDGLTIPAMIAGQSITIPVTVTNNTGANGFLNLWIDFNNNNALTDSGEQVASNLTVATGISNGLVNVTFTVPPAAVTGVAVGVRVRLSAPSGLGPTGANALAGEVEDYTVTIAAPTTDFGDFVSFGAASSVQVSTIRLGALTDTEFAATTNATATGDDTTGSDDEDAVTMPAMTVGAAATIPVLVTNTSGAAVFLNAWIDYNNNGLLTDAGEQIATNVSVATGSNNLTQNLSITVPAGAVTGANLGVRFRLTSTSAPGPASVSGNGEVEDYVVNIQAATNDFGDFASFGSASNAANTTLRLGALVDAEVTATTNATATGDDITGTDDEDGVTLPAMTAGQTLTVPVIVTNTTGAAAFLNAWIDFNNNGILTDAGEQVITNVSIATGSSGLTSNPSITIPATATTAVNLGVRFRLSAVSAPGATGILASLGEVEDYTVNIAAPTADFGDFATFASASSTRNATLRLGALTDTEFAATTNTTATGDDTTGSDDEDSVTMPSLMAGAPATIPVLVTNTSGAAAFLNAWIDYNNNGLLTDAGEQIATNVSIATGSNNITQNLNITVAATAVQGVSLGARFRLTSTSAPGATGASGNGEVEDYVVTISTPPLDYGDSSVLGSASSNANSNLRLGALLDNEFAPTLNATASGDDITGSDDEDGVTLPVLTAGAPATIPVIVTNTSGAAAFLNAWIDFNNDGDVADAGEQLATNTNVANATTNGTINLSFTVPTNAVVGANVALRFRLTNTSSPAITGTVGNGEVEDYVTTIAVPTTDFGDWTGAADASSIASSNLRMGALADTEFVSTRNATATGDDVTGSDDEDGVTLAAGYNLGAASSMTVVVTNLSGAVGYLNAWVDWNNNGSFTDAGEQIATNTSLATGMNAQAQTVNFTVPAGAIPGQRGARVRLTNVQNPTSVGAVGTGEVEDYLLTVNCPTITLSPTSLPNGAIATAYSQTITASGGSGAYAYSVSSGSLPAGLTLSSAGLLTGTPTSSSATSFTIRATDVNGCSGVRVYNMVPACQAITISPSTLATGTQGTAYSASLSALPTATYSWTIASGSLPAGLSLNATSGAISGTPTGSGTSAFTVRASTGPASVPELEFSTYNLDLNPGDTFNIRNYVRPKDGSTTPIDWSQVTFTYTAAGANDPTTPADWNLANFNSGLPVTVTTADAAAAGNTGQGQFRIYLVRNGQAIYDDHMEMRVDASRTSAVFSAMNSPLIPSACSATRAYTLKICPVINLNAITTTGTVGSAYSQTLSTSAGAAPLVFTVTSGTLPTGLTLNSSTGVISGIPTVEISSTVVVTATDASGCAGSRSYTLAMSCPPITINPATLPLGLINTAYSQTLTGSGGTAPYGSWTVTSGALPTGLTLNPSTGEISGTPTMANGSGNVFTVSTRDAYNCPGTRSYTLIICPVITVNPATLSAGLVGGPYSQPLSASGGTGTYTFAISSGALPAGLTLNPTSGLITGTPTSSSAASFIVSATDANGCSGTRSYSVTPALPTTDFGDFTLFPSASSTVAANLRLGTTVDAEAVPKTDATATGDDLDATDDEDGGTIPASLTQGALSSFPVTVTNTSGALAYLNVWVDFNRNGSLTDAGEQVLVNSNIATGLTGSVQTVSFSTPVAANLGVAGVRVRLTSILSPGVDGLDGNGEVEDYSTTIVVPTTDFGDDIDFADASSTANTSLRLGALVDAEGAATKNASSSGDDITSSDDEDSLTFPSVTAGQPVTLPVTVTNTTGTAAFLNAWIDYNNNGVLTDAGEQVAMNVNVATGLTNSALNLSFTIPTNAVTAASSVGARFRVTSTASPGATGFAGVGEVEDHQVVILAPLTDFGDHSGYADVSNTANSNVRLGLLVDTEYASTRNATATGDDVTGNDDEDGVTLPAMTAGAPATIPVTVTNTSSAVAYLNVWIDFNNNGVFTDSGEQIATNTNIAIGTVNAVTNLAITVPAVAVTGVNVGVRLRITSDISPGVSGSGGVGEVEDHVVNIAAPTTDFGDLSVFGSASSTRNATLRLGALIDTEFVQTANATATGDDITGSDDEDAVTFPALVAGGPATIPVVVTNTSGANAFLNVWIDYNNNGVLTDAGEQVAANIAIATGSSNLTQNLSVTIPATSLTGVGLGARIRLVNSSGATPTGAVGNGEVEDYLVNIAAPTTDFGDFTAFADASQGVNPALRMGALLDAEFTPTKNITATGDDTTGSDDEDGVVLPSMTAGQTVTIPVTITNSTGANGFLNAWIDYNNNGVLTDSGEQVATNITIATGANNLITNLSVAVPATATTGVSLGARFRISAPSGLGPIGANALAGEVEDHTITIAAPTTDFGDFTAFGSASSTANSLIKLGALTDTEFAATTNTTATGDDTTGTDDEDAVTFPALTAGGPATIPVLVTNSSGSPVFLNAWIDYNNNGVLTDSGEQIATNVSIATGSSNITQNLSITIPSAAVTGTNLGVRVRLTSAASPGATGASGNGEVEDYIVSIAAPTTDFGDFAAFASASNSANSTLRMGALVDSEFAATTNATATGDDTTGSDDEDGVTLPAMVAGQTYTIPVVVTNSTGLGAFLNAWIDLNNDGDVLDAGEQFMTNVPINTGSNGVISNGSLAVPLTAVTGTNVGLRFRVTTVSSPGATGALATVGEVEDYVVNIASPPTDFGDFAGFGNASSAQAATIRLGALMDTELVATTNPGATGDDSTGSDDEDAVTIPALMAGAPATVPVVVTNTSGAAVFLNAWIDYNNNGLLTDSGEQVATNISIATGSNNLTQNLSVTVPSTAVTGANIGVRIRLTSISNPGATGAAGFGEVEDYVVNIAAPTLDYGDSSILGSAASTSSASLRLGSLVDTEFAPTLNAMATGDDTTGSDDEDGVTLPMMTAGAPATIPVTVTNTSGTAAFLNAWIDFNNDGDVADAGEQLATNTNVVTGTTNGIINLSFTVPATAATGSSLSLRFRLTNTSSPAITGTVGNGEVEDYVTTIAVPTTDFGDWTNAADASSIASSNLRMGALADTEFVSTRNATATGDDVTGSDDEDGVTLAAGYNLGAASSLTVVVTNLSGSLGYLNAWVDWNNNGSFTDAGEQIATNTSLATGMNAQAQTVNFTVPAGAIPGQRGARVRLTNVQNPTSVGAVGTGEVEDYLLTVNCPTITLSPASLTTPTVGVAYSATVTASGGSGAYTYTVSSGTLPAGLSLASGTGVISGTPTSSASQTFAITATDVNGCTGSIAYTVVPVCTAIVISPTSLAASTVGTSYSQSLTASGGTAPYGAWTVTSGSLPAGLTLNATTGVISGTPTSPASATFTLRTTDANGCTGSRSYTMIPVCPVISISPVTAASGTVGVAYSQTLTASGGVATYTWTTVSGTWPAGLALSSAGVISGTPTASTGAAANITVRATDSRGCLGDQVVSLRICPVITLTPATLTNGTVGSVYSQTITASNGAAAYTYAVSGGSLPPGLTLTQSSGVINGTPTAAGSYVFTVRATDANGCFGSRAYSVTVYAQPSIGNLVWNDLDEDGLKDTNEPGVANVFVELLTPGADNAVGGTSANADTVVSTTSTNSLGNYEFTLLQPGAYYVRITPPDTLPLASRVAVTIDNGVDNDSNGTPLSTNGGPVVSPVIQLVSGTEPGSTGTGTADNTIDFGLVIGNSVLWLIDEDYTLSTALHLWSFTNYRTPTTTATDYGRLKYRRPSDGVIRDIADAGDIEAMAINRFTGEIYIFSSGRIGGAPSNTQSLWTYNLNDAPENIGNIVLTLIGHVQMPTSGAFMEALAYDPDTKRLYTADPRDNAQNSSTTTDRLYYLDIRNLNANPMLATSLTLVGDITGQSQVCRYTDGLEFSADGKLYAVDGTDDHVYEINRATGAIAIVSDNSIVGGPGGTVDVETMAWDEVSSRMIAVDNSGQRFIEVTLNTNGANIAIASFVTGVPGMPGTADLEASAMYDTYPPQPRVGVGNVVFIDANFSGRMDAGEGVNGVSVELYEAGDVPEVDAPTSITTSAGGGLYSFSRLLQDDYFIHIRASNFQPGGALYQYESLPGVTTSDDNLGEDGIDDADPAINGISSAVFTLSKNSEPTNANGETGTNATSDDVDDDNTDLTIDFGFRDKRITLGDLVWNDVNNDGIKGLAEVGIAGVTVQLLSPGVDNAIGGAGTSADTVVATTTTDSLGKYSFTVDVPGRYFVSVTPLAPYSLASSVVTTADNGVDNDNNGQQSSGSGSAVRSPVIQLMVGGEPGTGGLTSIENTLDFGLRVCPVVTLGPSTMTSGTAGTAYTQTLTASGGQAPYSYAVFTGALPAGLTLNSSTGVVSGTPTAGNGAGSSVTIRATDALGCQGTRAYILKICPFITVSPTALANGTVGAAYSQTLTASGGAAPYSFTVSGGSLPAWASLNSSTGIISGTPSTTQAASFTITATDANGCQGTRAFSIAPCPVITLNPATLPNAVVGAAYSQAVTATGGSGAYSYSLSSGSLPAWATLNASTGVISGTPTTAVSSSFTLLATDASGCTGTRTYSLNSVCPAITLTPAVLPSGTLGLSYSQTLSATGGGAPYSSWTVTSGALPAGLSLNASTGAISGTPTTTGSSAFTVRTTDSRGCQGSRSYTLLIKGMTLGNLIWQDNDNDGVRDLGEPGVAGAQVTLMSPGSDNLIGGTGGAADVQVGSVVTTTSTGSYSFTDLVPGMYFVRVVPPAAFTHTSGTPATTDNNIDNNNDGSQPGGPGTPLFSPIVTLSPGAEPTTDEDTDADTNQTLDFGLWAPLGVGNLVFIDLDGSGNFNFNEGIEGVYVYIFQQGADPVNDSPVGVAITDHKGRYFIDGLNPGSYFLHLPASQFASNALLAGMIPMTSVVAGDDNSGQDLLSSASPDVSGASTANFTLAPGAEPVGTAEGGYEGIVDDAFIDSNFDFTLDLGLRSPGGTGYPLAQRERNSMSVFGSAGGGMTATPQVSLIPQTYAAWSLAHDGAEDHDLYPKLLEYALDTDPSDGRSGAGEFRIETTVLGTADILFRRPANGRADIRYEIESSSDNSDWRKATITPELTIGADGRQSVRYSNVDAVFREARAFFRLKVSLDSNLDGTAEQTAASPTVMFSRETFPVGQRTFSMPLALGEVYAGEITQDGWQLTLPAPVTMPSGDLYIEDLSTGLTHEVNENLSSNSTLKLVETATVPQLSRIALRRHHTIGRLLPEDLLNAGDRVLIFNATANDFTAVNLTDKGWSSDSVLTRETGLLVHVRSAETTLLFTGQVSLRPIIKPAEVIRLMSSSSAVAESPKSLGLTSEHLFRASTDPGVAARLRLWKADADASESGYDQIYLSPIMWLREGDVTPQSLTESLIFEPFRAFFVVP